MRTIITREFLNNILNLRFSIGLLLSVMLTIMCVLILTHQYGQEMDDHNTRIALQDDFLNNYAHTNRLGGMTLPQKPPEVFRPFIIGIQRNADIEKIGNYRLPESFDDNPLPVLFPHIDFLFIVTIIMSLMAILFSYDAITGERERGTLKMLVSNSLSRATIIVSKWIGGLASLLIPLTVSLLIGVIYVTAHPLVHWDVSTWAAFSLLVLASMIFISLFYLLGLFVSCITRLSSISILTSLFLWVLLILVIPNISPFITAQLFSVPSVNRIEREVNRLLDTDRDNLGRELSREVDKKFMQEYGQAFIDYRSLSNNEIRRLVSADPEVRKLHEAYRAETGKAWNEANRIQGEKSTKLLDELELQSEKQLRIAKNLACLSPYSNFMYIATDLTGTGLRSIDHFQEVFEEYSSGFDEFVSKKVSEAKEADPTFGSNTFLDISDRPRFSFKEEPLRKRLRLGLTYWEILLAFNVLFFAGAFVKFVGYDVR